MNKRGHINYRILLFILIGIILIAGIVALVWKFWPSEYDKCDINKDGRVDSKERAQCEAGGKGQGCGQQGGVICASGQTCSGTPVKMQEGLCCIGFCASGKENQTKPIPEPAPSEDYEDSPFGFSAAFSFWADRSEYNIPSDSTPYNEAEEVGVKWTRGGRAPYFYWDMLQPDLNRASYEFKTILFYGNSYDNSVAEVPSDIHILLNIDPGSFLQSESWLPVDTEKYQAFVRAVVERYDGDDNLGCLVSAPDCYIAGDRQYPEQSTIQALKINPVKYWQISNEPAIKPGWAELQKLSYEAIKEADSEAKVVLAATTGGVVDYNELIDVFFEKMVNPLGGKYADIYDMHVYGDAQGEYRLLTRETQEDIINHLRTRLAQAGFSDMPIWITETGTNTGIATGKSSYETPTLQTEQQQALDLVKRYLYSVSRGVEKIFWVLNIGEVIWEQPEHFFSTTQLIYNGVGEGDLGYGVKKLSYYSYKLMTDKLEGSDWDNVQEVYNSGNVYAYKFIKNGNPIYVVWWDYWNEPSLTTKQASIPVSGITGTAKITEAVPHFENGLILQNSGEVYPNFFDVETKSVSNWQLTIVLGKNPVYVEQG